MVNELSDSFVFPRQIFVGKVGMKLFGVTAITPCEKYRAFLVSGGPPKKYAKEVGETIGDIGFDYKIWTSEELEAPLKETEKCAEEMREYEPDLLISVGGGSITDLTKMAWIHYEKPDVDLKNIHILNPLGLRQKAVMAAFPTTAGTGSEATGAAVASDMSVDPPRKLEISSGELVPDFAVLVPSFTAELPPELTAGSGLDVMAHAFGAYLCSYSNVLSDALAIQAMRLAFKWLPTAYENPGNMEARDKMLKASTIAGMAFQNSQTALTHSLGHAVGKAYGLHHGLTVGIFIPYCLRYYAKATDKYVDMAREFGIGADSKEGYLDKLDQKFKDLMEELDVSYALRDQDIDKEEWEQNLDRLTDYSYSDACTPASPRPTSKPEMEKLLNYAYEGKDVDF